MKSDTVVVIQNTHYHFETAMSLYKSLEDAGLDVHIHMCKTILDQEPFIKSLGVKIATEESFSKASCGFVVSAYPNPSIPKKKSVPNESDPSILHFGKRLVYVSHRFGSVEDYESEESPVKISNSVCLSPLSSKIGADYIFPIDMPVKPNRVPFGRPVEFTAQGHFAFNHRNINKWLLDLGGESKGCINFIGSNAWHLSKVVGDYKKFKFFSDLSEPVFYYMMNQKTHFLLPMIDENTRGGTYVKERYSSNFNHAFALEKPVLCHEIFKDVYKIPGLYYNDSTAESVAEQIFNMTEEEYGHLVDQFADVKSSHRAHNSKVLLEKVEAVSG